MFLPVKIIRKLKQFTFFGSGVACMVLIAACKSLSPEVTSMMLAARSGNGGEVRRLIAEGEDVDGLSRHGWTALMFAASKGHGDVARMLLDTGADPNIESEFISFGFMLTGGNYGETTALREAIRGKYFDIAGLLMDRGAEVDQEALGLAGEFGNSSLLGGMQRRGIAFQKTEVHSPVFLEACGNCNLDAAKWLASQGAKPDTIHHGSSALREAVYNDCPKMVRYLLDQGAKPNLRFGSSGYEETALFSAVQKHTGSVNFGKNLEIVSLLLSRGADRSLRGGGKQQTPYQIAEESRDTLRETAADPKYGETMRKQLAERLGYEEKMVRVLER